MRIQDGENSVKDKNPGSATLPVAEISSSWKAKPHRNEWRVPKYCRPRGPWRRSREPAVTLPWTRAQTMRWREEEWNCRLPSPLNSFLFLSFLNSIINHSQNSLITATLAGTSGRRSPEQLKHCSRVWQKLKTKWEEARITVLYFLHIANIFFLCLKLEISHLSKKKKLKLIRTWK